MSEVGEYTGDLKDLSRIQRQNLLGYRLRKLRLKQAYGNKIVLAQPEYEILGEDRPMAIPLADLATDKQVVMKFDGVTEHPDGSVEVDYDADHQPLAEGSEDIIDVLERTVQQTQMAISMAEKEKRRKALAAAKQFKVPEGCKVVTEEEWNNLMALVEAAKEAKTVPADSLGTAVELPKDDAAPKATKKTETIKKKNNLSELLQAVLDS